jgi:hypothetical protein
MYSGAAFWSDHEPNCTVEGAKENFAPFDVLSGVYHLVGSVL